MFEITFEETLLEAAFFTMACDGDIAFAEVAAIQAMASQSSIFGDLKVEELLNIKVKKLNQFGNLFITRFLRRLKNDSFSEDQKSTLLKVIMDVIYSDEEVEYNEIRFFRNVQANIQASNELVLKVNTNASELIGEEVFSNDITDVTKSQYFTDMKNIEFDEIKFS